MDKEVAVQLIEGGVDKQKENQFWADLGSGQGMFTKALSSLLPSGKILAVDKDAQSLNLVSGQYGSIHVEKIVSGIEKIDLPSSLTGILMANVIHYFQNQDLLIRKLIKNMSSDGRLIIVEYDIEKGNQWIPFPLSYKKLNEIMGKLFEIKLLNRSASKFHSDGMYSALITNFISSTSK